MDFLKTYKCDHLKVEQGFCSACVDKLLIENNDLVRKNNELLRESYAKTSGVCLPPPEQNVCVSIVNHGKEPCVVYQNGKEIYKVQPLE
jgi:hypothetical protein